MRIQHNIAALNSHRQLGANNNAVSKNLEKLSSGYRINRAGDDAAGLAISEKMRAQIKGLETATKNANDGISLVQTAEGALTEVHSMLNRMTELATQSANGTYDNDVDRANLQKEVESLKSEIDRIAESTNFNGINLLDGSLGSASDLKTQDAAVIAGVETVEGATVSDVAATKGQYEATIDLDSTATDGTGPWVAAGTGKQLDVTLTDTNGNDHTLKFTFDGKAAVTTGALATAVNGVLSGDLSGVSAEFTLNNKDTLDELNKIFSSLKTSAVGSDGLKFEATSATEGAAGVGLKSIKVEERVLSDNGVPGAIQQFSANTDLTDTPVTASTTTAGADAYIKLDPTALTSGSKITVGDHTFELKAADQYDITSGNVRVVIGKDDTETKKNLVAAMKQEGISSASLTSDGNIKIGERDELKTSDKTVNFNSSVAIESQSLGIKTDTVDATNGTWKFTPAAATADGTEYTFGINYTDAEGNAKSVNVAYEGGADDKATAQSIANAINKNEDTKDIFKASVNSTTGEITLEALNGKEGVSVKAIATTDAAGVGTLAADVASTRAGQTIEVTKTGIAKGDVVSVGGQEFQFLDAADIADPSNIKKGAIAVAIGADDNETAKNLQMSLVNNGIKATVANNKITIEDGETSTKASGGLSLQVGDTADDFNKVSVKVGNMGTKSLEIDNVSVADQEDASTAIDKIKTAINTVSSTRGDLGAVQNRLEHTINNLGVATENMTAAESRIRDVDMAAEMMEFTKNNILTQASQAMLAQANQLPQGVLQLLQ